MKHEWWVYENLIRSKSNLFGFANIILHSLHLEMHANVEYVESHAESELIHLGVSEIGRRDMRTKRIIYIKRQL